MDTLRLCTQAARILSHNAVSTAYLGSTGLESVQERVVRPQLHLSLNIMPSADALQRHTAP